MQVKIKIKDAVAHAGSITALSKLLNISRQAIHGWKGDNIPESSAWKFYCVTGHKVGEVSENI